MKPQHLVLPVLAAAALGIGLPALAQQSDSGKSDAPPKEVKVETTIEAKGSPQIKIGGVPDEKLQKVLNEALEFKGSDAEFAKKAEAWKKEHGVTVTRKGLGHVVITRDAKEGAVRIEVMRSGAGSTSGQAGKVEVTRKGDEVRELRVLAPKSSDGKDVKVEIKGLRETRQGEVRELEFLKDLPLIMLPKVFEGKDGVRVFLHGAEGKELTEKERAAIRKEMQALRKKLRSMPRGKGEHREFIFREGKPMTEKELKAWKESTKSLEELDIKLAPLAEGRALTEKQMKEMKEHMKGFKDLDIKLAPLAEGRALTEKQMKEMKEHMKGFKDLDIKLAPLAEGFVFAFGHEVEMIKGLSEADQKKMKEEIAKVHAEAQKKVAEITAKYKAKAKPAK